MKKTVLGLALACCVALFAADKTASIDADSMGFIKDIEESAQNKNPLPDFKYSEDAPGAAQNIERSFENAPPLIPHSLEGLVPITKDNNMCVTCHMPEFAKDIGSTAIPKSHLMDFRTGADLNGTLAEQRFNCTQCHVPQAQANPLVKNNFEADFSRYNDANSTSNLLDTLNQGAEVE